MVVRSLGFPEFINLIIFNLCLSLAIFKEILSYGTGGLFTLLNAKPIYLGYARYSLEVIAVSAEHFTLNCING
jgi:hypothetical protein